MKFIAALFLAAWTGLAAAAAENIADYRHARTIEPEEDAPWYRLDIPLSIQWQAAHADLRDLRVFNAEGESLPHALTTNAPRRTQERREARARLFPLYAADALAADVALGDGLRIRRGANGAVDIEVAPKARQGRAARASAPARKVLRGWLLDMGAADFAPEALHLDQTSGQEGFFRFSIEASDDLEHWWSWGEGQLVHLDFDGQAITRNEIRLPRHKARYLRLLWQDTDVAASVRGARLSGTVAGIEDAPLAWSPYLAGEPVSRDENAKERKSEGEFIWKLPLSLPLERVSIAVEEMGTLAPVILSGRNYQPPEKNETASGDKPLVTEILRGERRRRDTFAGNARSRQQAQEAPWRTLASGVVYRLPGEAGERVEDELELPGVPVNQLRLQIDPRGSGLGAQAPRIKVALRGRELTFLARGNAPYRLAYGRAGARAANLPLSTLIPADAAARIGHARIAESAAPPVPVASGEPEEETKTFTAGKAAFWVVLFMGAVLLAGMAFSLLRAEK
ncbi:MAG: DUF3999 domain-containing protein [Azoarcus sp.]|jgi:hypothetical protein|nr:DUF3999 domain-containing protein [Azoarcus sp.]